jgi:hypothetical protein
MALGKATGVPGTFTPTPVRATGSTERLSTHRGDDDPFHEGFDRDILKRENHYRLHVAGAHQRNKRRR